MRDRLIEILEQADFDFGEHSVECAVENIDNENYYRFIADALLANGVIVQEQGHWTINTDDYDCEYMVCSCCGEEFYNADEDTVDRTPKYCPNCGAKMNGLAEREGKK